MTDSPHECPSRAARRRRRAFDVSRKAGYVSFCRNETGRLLATLAATRDGTMAEFGTGCGVGTAWLRSGVRGEEARIVTAELDPRLARPRPEIFDDDPLVEVLAADWSTLLDKGPFSLLFLDSGTARRGRRRRVADLVADGGIVVLDDFTPCEQWPPIDLRPRRRPARAVADRRALHGRRGDGRLRRLHHHRDEAVALAGSTPGSAAARRAARQAHESARAAAPGRSGRCSARRAPCRCRATPPSRRPIGHDGHLEDGAHHAASRGRCAGAARSSARRAARGPSWAPM